MTCETSLPANTTRILWIRHGETAWNAEKRFQGHLDIPLNDIGHDQARRLAARLADEATVDTDPLFVFLKSSPIADLYASDLARAADTASYIARATGLRLNTLPGLRERNYGQLAGLTGQEMSQQHPDLYAQMTARETDAVLPGGESLQQFFDRIVDNTGKLVRQHAGQTLIVVVHGGVLDCIYRKAHGIDLAKPRQWLLANVSVNVVDHSDSGWRVLHWGDTRHVAKNAADEVDGRVV